MRYFRLVDDLYIPNRWHLGNVTRQGVDQKVAFNAHRPMPAATFDIEVTKDGRPLEFFMTAFAVRVAVEGLAMEMEEVASADFQRIPARIMDALGYDIVHCTRHVKCLDESRSEFQRWLPGDHRADLVGQYRSVTSLVIDPSSVPLDAHMFLVWGWVALIVSEKLKDAMEDSGCFGAKFFPVMP